MIGILSLVAFIIGVFMLLLLNKLPDAKIKDLYYLDGYKVETFGKIVKIDKTSKNNTKLLICDNTACAYVITKERREVFGENCTNLKAIGRVSIFRNDIYILADKIECFQR